MSFWDTRYAGEAYVYGLAPNDFLKAQSHRLPPGPVLLLADGEGRNAVYLAEKGHDAVSVDLSQVALNKAEALAADRGVQIKTVHADLKDYQPEPGHYSAVVAIFAHLPPPLRATVHQRAVAALKPGGVFLLEAYRPEQLKHGTGGPKALEMLMTLDDLRAELDGLEFEIAQEVDRDIQEGTGHSGPSATIQVLAVKPS